jgi:hypothetical protein
MHLRRPSWTTCKRPRCCWPEATGVRKSSSKINNADLEGRTWTARWTFGHTNHNQHQPHLTGSARFQEPRTRKSGPWRTPGIERCTWPSRCGAFATTGTAIRRSLRCSDSWYKSPIAWRGHGRSVWIGSGSECSTRASTNLKRRIGAGTGCCSCVPTVAYYGFWCHGSFREATDIRAPVCPAAVTFHLA